MTLFLMGMAFGFLLCATASSAIVYWQVHKRVLQARDHLAHLDFIDEYIGGLHDAFDKMYLRAEMWKRRAKALLELVEIWREQVRTRDKRDADFIPRLIPGVLAQFADGGGCRFCGRKTTDPILRHDGYCPVPVAAHEHAEAERLRRENEVLKLQIATNEQVKR